MCEEGGAPSNQIFQNKLGTLQKKSVCSFMYQISWLEVFFCPLEDKIYFWEYFDTVLPVGAGKIKNF